MLRKADTDLKDRFYIDICYRLGNSPLSPCEGIEGKEIGLGPCNMYWRAIFYWRFIVMPPPTLSCPEPSPIFRKNSAGSVSPLSLKRGFIFTRCKTEVEQDGKEGFRIGSEERGWPRNFRRDFAGDTLDRSPILSSGFLSSPVSLPLSPPVITRNTRERSSPGGYPVRLFKNRFTLWRPATRITELPFPMRQRYTAIRWFRIGYAPFP